MPRQYRIGFLRGETLALHTLVRLGAADKAEQRLAELADAQDRPLAPLCAEHARAADETSGFPGRRGRLGRTA